MVVEPIQHGLDLDSVEPLFLLGETSGPANAARFASNVAGSAARTNSNAE
jgi:hypothetical protein